MVASFVLLDEHLTFGTSLPFTEVVLEVFIAGALVDLHHAFLTEFGVAFPAFWGIFQQVYDSLMAVLFGADFDVWVIDGLPPQFLLFPLQLQLFWQGLEELGALRHLGETALLRA